MLKAWRRLSLWLVSGCNCGGCDFLIRDLRPFSPPWTSARPLSSDGKELDLYGTRCEEGEKVWTASSGTHFLNLLGGGSNSSLWPQSLFLFISAAIHVTQQLCCLPCSHHFHPLLWASSKQASVVAIFVDMAWTPLQSSCHLLPFSSLVKRDDFNTIKIRVCL